MRTYFAAINAASSGNNEIVAAVSGKKIKVVSYLIVAAGTVTATWKSASTALSGAIPLVANSGAAAAPDGEYGGHWLETARGEALNLVLSGAIAVTGHISYALET